MTPSQPEAHEESSEEDVKNYGKIQGEGEGKQHEKPVWGIQEGGLETCKEGGPTIDIWVPKSQVSFSEFGKSEISPGAELICQVPVSGGNKNTLGE